MLKRLKYFLPLLALLAALPTFAQRDTLTQEVEVIKAFKPTMFDANKISDMPKQLQTEHQKPSFSYSILSEPVFNTFSVNTLKAAAPGETREPDDGYGLVRAGLGNYNKVYGEFFIDHLLTKKTIFGIHARHLSSSGALKLEGGDRVKTPFRENDAEIYINQLFNKSILSFNMNFDHNGFAYYGYPKMKVPSLLKQEGQIINYFGTKQAFSKGGINISLSNPSLEGDENNFSFDAKYHYFGAKTGQYEHMGRISVKAQKGYNQGTGILETGFSYSSADQIHNRVSNVTGQRKQAVVFIKPAFLIKGKIANLRIGVNTWYVVDKDFEDAIHITPNILLNFTPVKDVLKLYAGVDGDFVENHYSKIAYENPFIDPKHDVANTFEKLRFTTGIVGKVTAKTNFKLSANYSIIDNQPFFFLHQYTYADPHEDPDPVIVDNTFKVLYDNMGRLKINFEVFHAATDKMELMLSGNYYNYNLNREKYAWNLPDWDANLSFGYKITEQIHLSSNIYLIGNRKALVIESDPFWTPPPSGPIDKDAFITPHSYKLNTALDLNVRGDYFITRKLSAFAQLNNFGTQKYERWFGYPVQSVNFLGGVSYAF